MIHGLMPRIGGQGHHNVSRDYAMSQVVRCQCTVCPVNKNGYCEVPSLIKISSRGVCEQAEKALFDLHKKEK